MCLQSYYFLFGTPNHLSFHGTIHRTITFFNNCLIATEKPVSLVPLSRYKKYVAESFIINKNKLQHDCTLRIFDPKVKDYKCNYRGSIRCSVCGSDILDKKDMKTLKTLFTLGGENAAVNFLTSKGFKEYILNRASV